MTQTTTSALLAATNRTELLKELKELKNRVIGNTWKKVEVAENEAVLRLLLNIISEPLNESNVDIVIETGVVIGALANVTIKPLILSGTHTHLLLLIRSIALHGPSHLSLVSQQRLLGPLIRAVRNLLVTTADLVWGHMWGVGAERKVLRPLPEDGPVDHGKRKEPAGKGESWRVDAVRALSTCFEQGNLSCLMLLVYRNQDPQVLLPLYQLFSRLIALPSHREALARWSPPTTFAYEPSTSTSQRSGSSTSPFILTHLLHTISTKHTAPGGRKANGKILEAALDLLAAVVKGQPGLAQVARKYNPEGEEYEDERDGSGIVSCLLDMLTLSPTGVRIAAANCLTNILKADKGEYAPNRVRSAMLSLRLLDAIAKLLRTEGPEDRVKICFVLAALVSDHPDLQKCAYDKGIPGLLLEYIQALHKEEQKGGISSDLAARSREAMLLALASLSFLTEPTRMLIAETTPAFHPVLLKSLSHSSYGVRAAACQLTRALSRGIAILRTSLVDSGIGEEIIHTLKREVAFHKHRETALDGGDLGEDDVGDRAFTVEVASTAAICNLITEFSPLQASLLRGGGIELLCELSRSSFEPLAQNALWAIKNLVYHAPDPLKSTVMTLFGWSRMRELLTSSTPLSLSVQALEIVQNLTADALSSEIGHYLSLLGEEDFLNLWIGFAREGQDPELRVPALFVMSNVALGNEKVRGIISSKVEILEVLSEALNSKIDLVKVPAIRSLRHLIESNAKTHRPRQTMLDLLQPYQLKTRLKELAETSPSLDVCHGAVGLLEVLERSREGTTNSQAAIGSAPK